MSRASCNLTRFLFLLIWFLLILLPVYSQGQNRDSLNSTRLNTFLIGTGVAYSASLIALNQLWYSDHPKESFHFFDDSKEWFQMDKVGHFYSAFHLSQANTMAFRWAGMSTCKSRLWGSVLGTAMLLPIELMDGYSSEYGASATDIIANFAGSAFFLSQEVLWQEIRIYPKFSFQPSGIASNRPEILGKNTREQLFKDYNGQTYWLSLDLHSFFGIKPKWLNLALGYGVENMINAAGQPTQQFPFEAYRQYYVALDVDLTHIKSSSKVVNTLLYLVNIIHLPAPAIEFNNQKQLSFHPLHF